MAPLVEADIKTLQFVGTDKPALQNIHLTLNRGDFVVVTGPIASGKSALCHCLTGAVPHFFAACLDGSVTIDGKNLNELALPEMAGLVGYMMQDPQNQIFSVTVGEDVAFGPGNLELPRGEIFDRVTAALEFVGLQGFEERSPETLSGGEAQRAVLAGILALKPQLLVLDQPTAELDPLGKKEVFARLGALNRTNKTTVIIVTNQPEELEPYASRYLVMKEGRIAEEHTLLPYQLRRFNTGEFRHQDHAAVTAGGAALKRNETAVIEKSTYVYPGGQLGCEDVNLKLHEGELVALLGLNGSGKTTVARHINALVRPAKGKVRVMGQDLSRVKSDAVRRNVGFLFQNPDYQIFAGSVGEEVGFSLKLRKVPPLEISRRVEEILEAVGLLSYINFHPHRLSRGQRQLLALASIVVAQPDIIVADEPTAGLDRSIAITIMELLLRQAAGGKTVLLVTHDLELAAAYAHRLVGMHCHRIQLDIPVYELPDKLEKFRQIGLDFGVLQTDSGLETAIG